MSIRDDFFYKKAKRRLGKVDHVQTLSWADTSLWAIQEALDVYRRERNPAALEEARKGAVGLLAAVDTLLDSSQ